ncbi:carotenoid biosynthesis protein [Paenibacillus sp. FSL R5-0749]|uniref:carotenoid biosynthesis protein n=2 Tax=unclassified Paenibacillus TaxID=185978 RepID=UPI00315A43A2
MGDITVVPVWIIQDLIVLIAAVLMVFYILDKETHPKTVLLQFIGFVFFYAAVFEITASSLGEGFYAYGRSILMLFNIPITVPIIEFLIIYSTLRVLKSVNIPSWTKPFITGLSAMVFDFSLDPVAVKQIFQTTDGLMARWTYYPLAGEPQIYGEPVMNFTGWIYIAGYWTVFILIGEWWHKKKGYSKSIGYIYPFLAAILSLACMFSPLSNFLNYMGPFFERTSNMQWVMLITLSVITIGILTLAFIKFWDRKVNYSITPKKDFPIMFTFVGFPLVNTIFCIIGGYTEVLWLVALAQIFLLLGWIGIYIMGKKASPITK